MSEREQHRALMAIIEHLYYCRACRRALARNEAPERTCAEYACRLADWRSTLAVEATR